MRSFFLFGLLLTACGETAFDTTIADTADRRALMAESVVIGRTTETELITRWGAPTQRVREGGQTELIYRSMKNPPGYNFPRFGDSDSYVIVTFQYGQAVAVRTSDTEGCRATFPPSPPGPGFPHLTTVHPTSGCPGVGPLQGRVHPVTEILQGIEEDFTGTRTQAPQGTTNPNGKPMVPSDEYPGVGKAD